MSLILRHCILSQKWQYMQKCVVFYNNANSPPYNSSYIKKFGPIFHTRHFSVQNDQTSDRIVIYKGQLTSRLRKHKISTFVLSIGGLCLQPLLFKNVMEMENITTAIEVCTLTGLFMIIAPFISNRMARRYVTQMYYNPKDDTYVAEVYNFFVGKKEIMFTKDDVYVSAADRMLTTCKIHGQPMLFIQKDFTVPIHYSIILGLREEEDFEMDNITQKTIVDLRKRTMKSIEQEYKQIESKQEKQNESEVKNSLK